MDQYQLPHHLSERVRELPGDHIKLEGEFVLYWMHHAVRVDENPALDVAILAAQHSNLPLVVYQGLSGHHSFNSDRHHTFIMQGARDAQQAFAKRGIRYCFYLSQSPSAKSPLYELANRAALVITEDFPAPPFPKWIGKLATSVDTPVWAVDAHCIVPMQRVGKPYQRAFAFRSAVKKEMERRLPLEWPLLNAFPLFYDQPFDFPEIDFSGEDLSDLCARCTIDHSVAPVPHTVGGSIAGYKRWSLFKEYGLDTYHSTRNDSLAPFPKGVSRMSAYLHHGHVSPFRIAREAYFHQGAGSEKYLDELIIWRELAFNLCFFNSNVESIDILPNWAKETLYRHADDSKPAYYSLEALELGKTEDALWNAAQHSLLIHGELHNNVRMTWGKALLQWTQDPQEALDTLIYLNHRYALDGSDPNSYGGLLWCLGMFDRPFSPERPIFGSVRTRPTEHHKKRLNMERYSAKTRKSPRSNPLHVAIIGAGMAGLAAARTLQSNGAQVKVFDKSRGPGGRMATRRVDKQAFDHGAQYFTVRDERFRRYVQSWIQDGHVQQWDGTIGTLEPEGNYTEKDISTIRYVGTPRMSSITRHMARDLDIRFKTRVHHAEFSEDQWHLADNEQHSLGAYDALIVTTPPLQALPLLQQSSTLQQHVEKVNMLPCWAVLASFDQVLEIPFDGLFVQESPLSWISRNSSKPERPEQESWILHASPEWSLAHLENDSNSVLDMLLSAFLTATGLADIKPMYSTAHRWRYALAEVPLKRECLWDADLKLAVSGDWCNGSRVEGAFLSGIAAAGRVAGLPDADTELSLDVQLSFPGLT